MPKSDGGIDLPDIQRYYWATYLVWVVDWRVHARCKGWVPLENLITVAELRSVPWFSKKHWMTNIQSHPLTGATLLAFEKASRAHAVSAKDCAITPIKGNLDFPPGLARSYLEMECPYAEMQAKHLFSKNRFLHQRELAALSLTKSFPFLAFLQIKHYLDNPATRGSFTKVPTVFE